MEKIIKYMEQRAENISENEVKEYYDILMNYILVDFNFIKSNKITVFMEYFSCLILEEMGYQIDNHEKSFVFKEKYKRIQDRISISIDELKYKEEKDFDYENEILVIAFRILKYFELDNNRLYLNMGRTINKQIKIHNDYRSNVYICEVEGKDIDYVSLKLIEEKINALRKEIEYLNDFILNYYQEYYLQIFRISKIVFDKENIAKKFIQGEVKFRASFKVIQKLIGPLYLNKESYGMRELIQNAVDACLNNENGTIDISYYNEEKPYIIIKDNGIGMSEDIICNKFLTIGESTKKGDASIGKFGIGVLAAFLLADKMKFKTYHNNETFIYESEEIALEAVQKEEKFINIRKYENRDGFQGTEITLELKNSILENIEVANIQTQIKEKERSLIKNLFGLNNYYGSLWYGYSTELTKMKAEIPAMGEYNFETNSEGIKEIIEEIKNYNKYEVEDVEEKCKLKNKVNEFCKKALVNIEKKEHLEAYSIFEFLAANNWYLQKDKSITINFGDGNTKLQYLYNFSEEELLKEELLEEQKVKYIENISNEFIIRYFWKKEYAGNIFCNNMLIPTKYNFESSLAKVFKILPTILVDESQTHKLEIDLARENCKLTIGGKNYEELILKEICSKCLQNLERYHNILQELSWLYYIDENNQIRKVIKSHAWILEHTEKKYLLVYVQYENDEEFFKEKLNGVIQKLIEGFGENIVIEIVRDCLKTNTTFNDKEYNDLYIAARYQLQLIITNQEYIRLSMFSKKHLKALVLAANNILGDVNVDVDNQLKLKPVRLEQYHNDAEYLNLLSEKRNNKEVEYLDYKGDLSRYPDSFPDDVVAIMVMDLENCNTNNAFRDIAKVNPYKRGSIWNGFQEGISEVELLENDELRKILMKVCDK